MSEYSRVYQIYKSLVPKPHDLLSENRFFIREGYLSYWDDKKNKLTKRYFFLFNDILLVCKKEAGKKFWLRIHITLRSPHVSVDELENPFQFRLNCRARSFTFHCDNSDLKAKWVDDILGAVSGLHDEKQERISKDREQLLKNPKISSLEKKTRVIEEVDYDEVQNDELNEEVVEVVESENNNQQTSPNERMTGSNNRTNNSSKKKKKKTSQPQQNTGTGYEELLIDLSGPPTVTNPEPVVTFDNYLFGGSNNNGGGSKLIQSNSNPFTGTQDFTKTTSTNPFLTNNNTYQTSPQPTKTVTNPFNTQNNNSNNPFDNNQVRSNSNPFLEDQTNSKKIEDVFFM